MRGLGLAGLRLAELGRDGHQGRVARLGRAAGFAAVLASATLSGGCATTGAAGNPADPFEPVNRRIDRFNTAVDRTTLKPIAEAYENYVPEVLRFAAGNFVANLGDIYTAANQLLQFKPIEALQDLTRFAVNTTFGFFGIGDVASALGLPKHYEDFGQTLGVWGVPSGPYVVLPLFGPSTARDAPARIPDTWYGNALDYTTDSVSLRNSAFGLKIVSDRADLLQGEKLIDGVALDRYSLIRDGYLQRRRAAVLDGEVADDELPSYDDEDDYDPGPSESAAAAGEAPASTK